MPRVNEATQGWKRFSDVEINTEAEICINKILSAPAFSSLTAQATQAHDARKAFGTTLESAKSGSRVAVAEKNANRSTLNDEMNNLAVSVNSIAKGDLALLRQTDLPTNKPNNSPVPQEKPTGVTVVNGVNSGEIVVKVKEAVSALSLIYQYTFDPITSQSIWISKGATRKTFTFDGLPSATRVWFRVISVGRNNGEMMSDVVSTIVL